MWKWVDSKRFSDREGDVIGRALVMTLDTPNIFKYLPLGQNTKSITTFGERKIWSSVLYDVYSCVMEHGFPSTPSQIIHIFDDHDIKWMGTRISNIPALFEDIDMTPHETSASVDILRKATGVKPRNMGMLITVINGYLETFITVETDADPESYYMKTLRLGGGDGNSTYTNRRMVLSELLVYHCQNVLVHHLTESDDMESAHIRHFFKIIAGHDVRLFNIHEWKRSFGLNRHRMDDVSALFRAIGIYNGVYRKMPRLELSLVDLRNKSRRVLEHKKRSLFNHVFGYKVEFDNSFSDNIIMKMESTLVMLIDIGVVKTLGPQKSIRFRRFSSHMHG